VFCRLLRARSFHHNRPVHFVVSGYNSKTKSGIVAIVLQPGWGGGTKATLCIRSSLPKVFHAWKNCCRSAGGKIVGANRRRWKFFCEGIAEETSSFRAKMIYSFCTSNRASPCNSCSKKRNVPASLPRRRIPSMPILIFRGTCSSRVCLEA